MNTIYLLLYFVLIVALVSAYIGFMRYKTPLNPLTFFAVIQFGLFTLFSGIVAINMPIDYSSNDIIKTLIISLIYLIGVTIPYYFSGNTMGINFGKVMNVLGLKYHNKYLRFSWIKFATIIIIAAVSFLELILVGGGGLLWFTNTREAYINFRSGAGPFFAFTQWLLTFGMVYIIWYTKPKKVRLIVIIILFSLVISLLGSKNNILSLWVIGILYYNYYVCPISFSMLFILGSSIIIMFFCILVFQGSYLQIIDSVVYFRDYFDTTARFISRFDEFGFRYGQAWISSFWFYIPRGLFLEKPYVYGETVIHDILFPGATEEGQTPGLLIWSLAYLDFGVIGVFLSGLFIGIFQRMTYENFILDKQNIFSFLLTIHFSFWPIWTFSSFALVIIITLFQSVFLKLRFSSHNS